MAAAAVALPSGVGRAARALADPLQSQSQSEDTYDGSQMWLHYVPVIDKRLLDQYRRSVTTVIVENARHPTAASAHPNDGFRTLGGRWVSTLGYRVERSYAGVCQSIRWPLRVWRWATSFVWPIHKDIASSEYWLPRRCCVGRSSLGATV